MFPTKFLECILPSLTFSRGVRMLWFTQLRQRWLFHYFLGTLSNCLYHMDFKQHAFAGLHSLLAPASLRPVRPSPASEFSSSRSFSQCPSKWFPSRQRSLRLAVQRAGKYTSPASPSRPLVASSGPNHTVDSATSNHRSHHVEGGSSTACCRKRKRGR